MFENVDRSKVGTCLKNGQPGARIPGPAALRHGTAALRSSSASRPGEGTRGRPAQAVGEKGWW